MIVPFSERTTWSLAENQLTKRVRALREAGKSVVDLSESNPTKVGLAKAVSVAGLLAQPGSELYRPEPLGLLGARRVIAENAGRARHIEPHRMVLSASTSEAYTWLFKLLSNPGDEVLVPTPSYPLFGFLADVEAIRLVSYPLIREEGFRIDLEALERAITPRTRAIIVVHPNNPTGTFTRRDDAMALGAIAARRGLAIISDEVFGDYAWSSVPEKKLESFAFDGEALTFVLSGLSKVVCAPQLKLGWTSVHGPEKEVARAMERLEVIADTFLSVSTPVQLAVADILGKKIEIQEELKERIARNRDAVFRAIAELGSDAPIRCVPAEAGWSVILEAPRTRSEEEWIDTLLDEEHVLLHPGYFFDMDREGFFVVSLIPEPTVFSEAIGRVVKRLSLG